MNDKYVTNDEKELLALDDRMERALAAKRTLTMTFPCRIKQLDDRTLEIELDAGGDIAFFTKEMVAMATAAMGKHRTDIMLDDVANTILRRIILDGVR